MIWFTDRFRGDDLRGHIEIGIGRRFADPIFQLEPDDEYFSVDGLVSGIKSHMIEAPSKATAAILRNVVVRPKFAAIRPKTAVLSAAPIPDAVPIMP